MSNRKQLLTRFQNLFDEMGAEHVPYLEPVYHEAVLFRDPLTEVRGRRALETYFSNAYANVIQCEFDYGTAYWHDHGFALPWTMTLHHRRLRRGKPITVEGMSLLRIQDERIGFHRDYYDVGQLLYEQIPVLGSAIRWLRRYAA